ncbi:MAG TPA: hypothetical protein VFO60_00185, partial [Candidatus Dormibacteraeota bacterium]|nr:hypothetical protein [Candidatus Dormibacteraeota bacterium]
VAESNAALASMQATLEQVRTELETARTERSSMNDELEGRNGEIRVLRDRLRDEIATRTEAVNRVEALEQEIRDLAGDVLAADVNRQRKGVFRRLVAPPKGAGGGPPPKRMPAAPPVDDQRRKADAPPPGALGATDDKDLDALLDRRLFGS